MGAMRTLLVCVLSSTCSSVIATQSFRAAHAHAHESTLRGFPALEPLPELGPLPSLAEKDNLPLGFIDLLPPELRSDSGVLSKASEEGNEEEQSKDEQQEGNEEEESKDEQQEHESKKDEHAVPAIVEDESGNTAKRVLVTCLQSSGCSLFMEFLGQVDESIAFVDVFVYEKPESFPSPEQLDLKGAKHVVLGTTLQGDEISDPMTRLGKIKQYFQPDRTILFMRDPFDNFDDLLYHTAGVAYDKECDNKADARFGYGARCGSPQGKLRALERLWQARDDAFDAVVLYSDLIGDQEGQTTVVRVMNQLKYPVHLEHFQFLRPPDAIETYSRERMGSASFEWGLGDAVVSGPLVGQGQLSGQSGPSSQSPLVNSLCPTLSDEIRTIKSYNVDKASRLHGSEIQWFASRADHTRTLVLVFVSSHYVEILLNWITVGRSRSALGKNYAIVCLDDELEAFLHSHGETCFPARHRFIDESDGSLGPLWLLRVRYASSLVDHGLNIVLSDIDAMWLRDPTPDFIQAEQLGADIVASRGSYPKDVNTAWGTTACMGFTLFRATQGSTVVLRAMLRASRAKNVFDDQVLLNTVLYNANMKFPPQQYENSTEMTVASVELAALQSRHAGNASLALLPHSRFARVCPENVLDVASVAHCYDLQGLGLWKLRSNWGAVDNNPDFDTWVKSLSD